MKKTEKTLVESVIDFISKKKLMDPGEKVLLAVSGGLDSSVMVHLFSKAGFDFGIAHCNFSLRGKESDGDEAFVAGLAKKYGKQFYSIRFDTNKFAEENKYSVQEAARILRYQWFYILCDEFNYEKIATAHHLNDSIETFFINLMRGTGTAGLRGISVVNKKIIRPLLFARRSEIEAYAKKEKIKYREDSSNAKDDYLRNRIRHHVIPAIMENAEGFEDLMENLMEDLSFVHEIALSYVKKWKKKFIRTDNSKNTLVPLKNIREEEYPTSFLSLLLYSEGIKGVDCDKILAAKSPGKHFISKEFILLRDRENLIIQKKKIQDRTEFSIPELPSEINIGDKSIRFHSKEKKSRKTISADKNLQQVDFARLCFPLVLRPWKAGDYFIPLGMKGKKKISDYFTDIKLNSFEKDKIYLLLSGSDIVCILGHRIDDRYKITPSTKNILTIEIR